MALAPIAPAGAAVLQQDVVGGRASGAWDYPLSNQEKNWRLLALFQREVDDLQCEVAEFQQDADHWEDRCAKLMARSSSQAAFEPANADKGPTPAPGAEANVMDVAGVVGNAVEDAQALSNAGATRVTRPSPSEASMRRLRLSQSATMAAGHEDTEKSTRRQRRAMRREPFKVLDSTALRTEAARIAEVAQSQVADLGGAATARAQYLVQAVQPHAKDLGDSAEQLGADLADKAKELGESLAQFWGESSFPFPSGAKDSSAGDGEDPSCRRRRPQRRASWALGDLFGATEAERPNGLEVAESWAVANSPAVDALWSAEPRPDARTEVSPCME